MSNYRLSASCRSEIHGVVQGLSARIRAAMSANFPLPAKIVQRFLVTEEEEKKLRELQTAGFKPLPVETKAIVAFDAAVFGLKRDVTVLVYNEAKRFWTRLPVDGYYGAPGSTHAVSWDRNIPNVPLELVPPELRPALVKWIENQITHLRMIETLAAVSEKFFTGYNCDKYLPTVGHCAARWPTAIDLGRMTTDYKSHFNNPPGRKMDAYPWPTDAALPANFRAVLNMASQAVATALMLPKVTIREEPYRAQIRLWRRLPTDWHGGLFE